MPFPWTIRQFSFKLDFKLDRTFLIALIVLPATHIALAHLSTSIALEAGVVAVWPSIAVYIAAIILFGYHLLPILWLGELLVNFTLWSSTYSQHSVAVLLLFLVPNTIDALITPVLYKLWIPEGNLFAKV
ncbi:MAG: MASE1 domain-containing protein, partial [Microcoleus sp.]